MKDWRGVLVLSCHYHRCHVIMAKYFGEERTNGHEGRTVTHQSKTLLLRDHRFVYHVLKKVQRFHVCVFKLFDSQMWVCLIIFALTNDHTVIKRWHASVHLYHWWIFEKDEVILDYIIRWLREAMSFVTVSFLKVEKSRTAPKEIA